MNTFSMIQMFPGAEDAYWIGVYDIIRSKWMDKAREPGISEDAIKRRVAYARGANRDLVRFKQRLRARMEVAIL